MTEVSFVGHVAGKRGESGRARYDKDGHGSQRRSVVLIGADDEHRAAERRRRSAWQAEVGPPQLTGSGPLLGAQLALAIPG